MLDDEVRAVICSDKITTDEWLAVMRAAHGVGLKTTATIMFGHVESYHHWARHLLHIRDLQADTGGFTEFVPLPFVHMEAPLWRKGLARSDPSFREILLMHAVAQLVLHPLIPDIQASWVKLGGDGFVAVLNAGGNDLGGTQMDESITRAAGGQNGQLCDPARMIELAAMGGGRQTADNAVRAYSSSCLGGGCMTNVGTIAVVGGTDTAGGPPAPRAARPSHERSNRTKRCWPVTSRINPGRLNPIKHGVARGCER